MKIKNVYCHKHKPFILFENENGKFITFKGFQFFDLKDNALDEYYDKIDYEMLIKVLIREHNETLINTIEKKKELKLSNDTIDALFNAVVEE